MKQFSIPAHYRSPIISQVKAFRKAQDPRKKDFTPTRISFGAIELVIARHFGFCYGVENAIEKAYAAIHENPGKNIYLLSQMIHNPGVNEDLEAHGLRFIQDTSGKQIIPWDEISKEDVVIIPAFGTTVEIEELLTEKGVELQKYNTTCPFVEKVWNRSEKLAQDNFTLIIHGKYNHEETRATFSHTAIHTHAVIVKDLKEAEVLGKIMTGELPKEEFYSFFEGKYSVGFNVDEHLNRVGVINQTTMLASETQEIADYFKQITEQLPQAEIADTRDTLCYATNDNQGATIGLMESDIDMAIVVGGYNSSNTTHLVELLEKKCPTFYIKDETELVSSEFIQSFNIHTKEVETVSGWLNGKSIAITSGASCPDAVVDRVINRLLALSNIELDVEQTVAKAFN